MKFSAAHLLILFTCFIYTTSCAHTKDSLQAATIKVYGRSAVNDKKEVELIASAAHLGFSFDGTTCTVNSYVPNANEHSYLQYELDGVYQKRIRIDGNNQAPFVITGATAGKHTVWIYKATEAQTGPVFIGKITAKNLLPLTEKKAPIIEFIGNSITCGAASDPSEIPCGSGVYHDQHNAYYAYGPRVARALGVNFMMSSVSGIGIYRNWNSDGPTMPQVYEKTDFQETGNRNWDFKTYTPAIVSIALGTNDYSNGDGVRRRLPFDSASFVSTYIPFVQMVKSKYPTAQIALLTSPMVNGDRRVVLQNCITAVKQQIDKLYPKDKPVATYFFNPMQARGCGGHPSVEDHAILAAELLPFFKKLL